MSRRRVTVATAAAFAICAAFAAKPTSLRADFGQGRVEQRSLWFPGSDSPMSAHEPHEPLLAAPR
jgi:hypothetical protein